MKLTPQQQKVFDLLSNAPGYLTWQEIAAALWGDRAVADPRKSVNVLLTYLRKSGVSIQHGGRNKGWRIAREQA